MKKNYFVPLIALIFMWTSMAWALPILNDGSDVPIQYGADGVTPYGTYTNSGSLLFVEEGNNLGSPSRLQYVEGLVRGELINLGHDVTNFQLIQTNVNYSSPDGGLTGIWATDPSTDEISFYAVKAGSAFAMYLVLPPDSTGSWSTWDLWDSGFANSGAALEISHFTGYNPSATTVPEPAAMLLLGTGLVGLAGWSRRKIKK